MNLPNLIATPHYDFVVPSTGKKIQFRPFLVKEQKILLIALASKNEVEILNSIKQVISNCIITKDFNINELASFDLEYFFIQLRVASVGKLVQAQFVCDNPLNDEEKCGNILKISYDITQTKVDKNPKHSNKIMLTDDVGVVMKYPSLGMFDSERKVEDIEYLFSLITSCIDYVFDKETVYKSSDYKPEELSSFVENLTKEQFDKIEEFFDTMPVVKQVIAHKCSKCGFEHSLPLEGLQSFFD